MIKDESPESKPPRKSEGVSAKPSGDEKRCVYSFKDTTSYEDHQAVDAMTAQHVFVDLEDNFLSFLEEAASLPAVQEMIERDVRGDNQVGNRMLPRNDRLHAVESGFRITAVDQLLAVGLSHREIEALIGPLRTLDHQRHDGRSTREETNVALRVARLLSRAERTLGSCDRALAWLRRPNRTFGNAVPLMLLSTEAGGRRVEDLLLRADYGQMA